MKELQGQFDTDFEKWLTSSSINKDVIEVESPDFYGMKDLYDLFYELPICAQFGIVQLFADSLGVDLYIKPRGLKKSVYLDDGGHHIIFDYLEFDTYPEAQQEAITQFEKWYNEQR